MDKAILAGDVGGTKTILALFPVESGTREPLVEATFPSREYPSLEILIREFLSGTNIKVGHACFGVPGPVIGGRARVTNLPWVLHDNRLARAFGFSSVKLLNDLLACAYAVPSLSGNDLYTINPGRMVPGGAKVIVAPGTGLGEAYMTWDGERYQAHPSEGGHADFAPTNILELGLLKHLLEKFDHVSYERVCSGSGLPNIYSYLRDSGRAKEPDWLKEQLRTAEDPTAVIMGAALATDPVCLICQMTLDVLIGVLGAEAGNAALKMMATAGVYLAGGLSPRLLSTMKSGIFMAAFRRKGRLSQLMADIPVHIIMNQRTALLGAAHYCLTDQISETDSLSL